MRQDKGVYIGVNNKATSPIVFDVFAQNRGSNEIVLGQAGTGKSYYNKMKLIEHTLMQHIINNHLNNNGWLKRHGKPMVRKGHPLYKECKKYKGAKPTKLIVIDPEEEYKEFIEKIGSDSISLNPSENGIIDPLEISNLLNGNEL